VCKYLLSYSWWLNELGTNVIGLPNNSYKPIINTAWVRTRLCKLQKGWIRLAAASDKVYQLLAHFDSLLLLLYRLKECRSLGEKYPDLNI
jgi:hypothetical protein